MEWGLGRLAELRAVANLPSGRFQEIVDGGPDLRLKASFCLHSLCDPTGSIEPHGRTQIIAPVKVGFNKDEFFGRDVGGRRLNRRRAR